MISYPPGGINGRVVYTDAVARRSPSDWRQPKRWSRAVVNELNQLNFLATFFFVASLLYSLHFPPLSLLLLLYISLSSLPFLLLHLLHLPSLLFSAFSPFPLSGSKILFSSSTYCVLPDLQSRCFTCLFAELPVISRLHSPAFLASSNPLLSFSSSLGVVAALNVLPSPPSIPGNQSQVTSASLLESASAGLMRPASLDPNTF